ncbi:28S ribosomal protein S30 mitochondrial [Biomphalaria pfeifferi]|uniref:28S ribosomal protein S30 mitochondrial n=1 Tax=Biomphalaria pfeifferi TaxID=112525 RepID=A0AAD8FBI5_BIOPF|nr:28S ribosomal protein S30 mitochondrial [Biomphalaria pfeifferi]
MTSLLVKNTPQTARYLHILKRYLSSSLKQNTLPDLEPLEQVAYPPIKPKFPEGTWGKMDHKYAWQWQELKENFLGISSIQERLSALLKNENMSMLVPVKRDWCVHNFDERIQELNQVSATVMDISAVNEHPATLQFREYITKTLLLPWKDFQPNALKNFTVNNIDTLISELKQHISDHLLLQHEIRPVNLTLEDKKYQCQLLFRSLSDFLIAKLGNQREYLKTSQFDEKVLVRALWSRHGFERKKKIYVHDPDVTKYDIVQDQHMAFQSQFDAMIKSHLPLTEFVPRDAYLTTSQAAPKLPYRYTTYGQEKPLTKKKPKNILAGHRLGDPCEFGLVGLLSTLDTESIEKKLGPKVGKDCRLSFGITSVFSWLTAQACYQGFSHIVDVAYPLASQLILSDGHKFSFLAYQLNTLELWKDDEGNPLLNPCWHTEEMPLYHSVENGQVREFNDDVLRLLIQTFAMPATDRGYNMKPTLPAGTDLQMTDFIPRKVFVPPVIEEEQYIVS